MELIDSRVRAWRENVFCSWDIHGWRKGKLSGLHGIVCIFFDIDILYLYSYVYISYIYIYIHAVVGHIHTVGELSRWASSNLLTATGEIPLGNKALLPDLSHLCVCSYFASCHVVRLLGAPRDAQSDGRPADQQNGDCSHTGRRILTFE